MRSTFLLNPVQATPKPADPGSSAPVDIFGNPIEDVDRWMRDQDKKLAAETKKAAADKAKSSERPRLIKSLLGRFVPGPASAKRTQPN